MLNTLAISRSTFAALILSVVASSFLAAETPPPTERPRSPLTSSMGEYVIGVEDGLRIVVWGEPELTISVQVRPDGRITVPLVDDISVVGLTALEIRDQIKNKLERFIRDVNVTVVVEKINSFRVYFLGEVNNQGAILFYSPTRLLQGIAAAGGLTQFSKKEVVLLRETLGVEKRLIIDYKRLIAGDPRQENLFLMPGDTLVFN